MNTETETPARCESADQMQRAEFALGKMLADGVIDFGALKHMLRPVECDHAGASHP
jgi:hypothetical protein